MLEGCAWVLNVLLLLVLLLLLLQVISERDGLQSSCQDFASQVSELQSQVEVQEQLLEEREAALIDTQDSVQVRDG